MIAINQIFFKNINLIIKIDNLEIPERCNEKRWSLVILLKIIYELPFCITY